MISWSNTPENSPVWILPGEKPVEYIYEVKTKPHRPCGLETSMAWGLGTFPEDSPQTPKRVLYLGALEWMCGVGHSRMDHYYLSYTDSHWIIYLHDLSDGFGGSWEWYPYSAADRVDADIRSIAFWMVHDLLSADASMHEVDSYSVVSAEGFLSVGDFSEIGHLVWKEEEEE